MLNLQRYLKPLQCKRISAYFLPGDVMVLAIGVLGVFYLFQLLWSTEHATKVQIRLADKIYATYSLLQMGKLDLRNPRVKVNTVSTKLG
jgi:hypothetical protein